MKIIGIAGSLRKASYNAALLRAAQELAPDQLDLHIASISNIPLYNFDVEAAEGIPEPVQTLKDAIASSAGVILATPEYNNSVPGVFKNAIDWLSRPPADIKRVFGDTPVALMGATPGQGGTRMAQTAWLPILRTLGMRPYFGQQFYVAGASRVFDESGRLTDASWRERLAQYMAGFAAFVTQ